MRSLRSVLLLWWALCFVSIAHSATSEDVLTTDLTPLIDAAAGNPEQFAVSVPYSATLASQGNWSTDSGVATWRFNVRVPSAVSLSFRAVVSRWPEGATLSVSNGVETATYAARDFRGGELWSRVALGEALSLQITLPAADQSQLSFAISSLQVGYRPMSGAGSVHPRFRTLQERGIAATDAGCTQNFKCSESAGNAPQSRATVALTISNVYLCTGTLLNNTLQDGTPFVLTARHCQGPATSDGSDVARSVRVFWNATSACGAVLGTINSFQNSGQAGAVTRVEQQDAWLIELDELPVYGDAYYAGWDASGAAVTGGYSIHHGSWLYQQYTGWFGQAVASFAQRSGYQWSTLYVTNELGNISPGASGGAVFDASHRVVGSLSTAAVTSSGEGVCPVSPLVAPTAASHAATATAFAGVFNSSADTTSRTGNLTIKYFLDKNSAGTLVQAGFASLGAQTLTTSDPYPGVGQLITLSWSAPFASSCTAFGGQAGDGWSGSLGTSGSRQVTQTLGIQLNYGIQCQVGSRAQRTTVRVQWFGNVPFARLSAVGTQILQWVGAPMQIRWESNVPPCTLSGGSLSLTTSQVSGVVTVTEQAAGTQQYKISCGAGATAVTETLAAEFTAPGLEFKASNTFLRVGQQFRLSWKSGANSCTPSGGIPGGGWTAAALPGSYSYTPATTVAGTYTFGLTCRAGSLTSYAEVTVQFDDSPPFADFEVVGTTFLARAPFSMRWRSNLIGCEAGINYPSGYDLRRFGGAEGLSTVGEIAITVDQVGKYSLYLQCQDYTTSQVLRRDLTVDVTHAPPVVSLIASPTEVEAGKPFTLTWNAEGADFCEPTGELASRNGWFGEGLKGSASFPTNGPGTQSSSLTCSVAGVKGAPVSVSVKVVAVTYKPAESGGGGGGGGLDLSLLGVLATLVGLGRVRPRRPSGS